MNSDWYKQIRHRFLFVGRYDHLIGLKKMWTVRRTSVSNIVHKFTNKFKWCQLKQCSHLEMVKIPNRQPHVDSYGINVLSCTDFYVVKISGYIYIIHQKPCILQALRALKFSRHGHIDKIIKVIYAFGCCVLACWRKNKFAFILSFKHGVQDVVAKRYALLSVDLQTYHGTYEEENRFR